MILKAINKDLSVLSIVEASGEASFGLLIELKKKILGKRRLEKILISEDPSFSIYSLIPELIPDPQTKWLQEKAGWIIGGYEIARKHKIDRWIKKLLTKIKKSDQSDQNGKIDHKLIESILEELRKIDSDELD